MGCLLYIQVWDTFNEVFNTKFEKEDYTSFIDYDKMSFNIIKDWRSGRISLKITIYRTGIIELSNLYSSFKDSNNNTLNWELLYHNCNNIRVYSLKSIEKFVQDNYNRFKPYIK